MEVILTHEQADFDAIASLLGAYLLNPKARPVLPRRFNRNVRTFLTFYETDLPFIDAAELPPDPIEVITLVDTQSLITLKGLTKKTSIYVIDHHPLRSNLPPGWTVSTYGLGACTTLFVENIRCNKVKLTPPQATLLLLGIYEDSGSLSYAGTTSRDVRAAAYLLDQGGSLNIAAKYLNPPLSTEQIELYDRLLASVENVPIDGRNIVIASAEAMHMSDEISSVAHKLRDLLNPAALFIMVHTAEGVRLVARSTTETINVSAILANFGGGGHERAASALIRLEESPAKENGLSGIDYIHAELLRILPKYILPEITVEQIMSRGPLLLAPEMLAEKAVELMQRYGYEGYPVVKDGVIVGLLTRHAVDRAIRHKMNLPISSLMKAGNVHVYPKDTIEDLQRIMNISDWGQIPVIEPASKKIIGIVTRTDLIKTMGTGKYYLPGRQNLALALESAMPFARLALLRLIADEAFTHQAAAYIVGGFVRDLLLKRPCFDFDVVIEGNAIDLGLSLSKRFGGRIVAHRRFGTAKWWIADIRPELAKYLSKKEISDPNDLPESLDLISARTEFYDYPTALPTVERSSIKLDLHRRDFSINTLALRLDGQYYGDLYDYWDGLHDVKLGQVRALHSLSFVDDPTRMLRAVRFEQRFNFHIEARTLQLMDEAQSLLRQVSGDRLRHELDLIFQEERAIPMMARLEELDLLNSIHSTLTWNESISARVEKALSTVPDPEWKIANPMESATTRKVLCYLLWMIQPPCQEISLVSKRLRFPNQLNTALESACSLYMEANSLSTARPSQIVQRFERVPLISLYVINFLDVLPDIKEKINQYIHKWQFVRPMTSGKILLEIGIKPGPAYRKVLEQLRSAWLDDQIKSAEEERALLEVLLTNIKDENVS
jgi:tRNA nucleotidyltransferase (CCA-adding enzyme)